MLIIRKKIVLVLSMALCLASMPKAYAVATPQISAGCAIVTDSEGQILYQKNAEQRALIASLTKIMTALVALENSELDDRVLIKAEHCGIEGSSMGLKAGEEFSVEELLLGLLLVSGNDAALALADHTAGSESAFVDMMNEKASALSMDGTSFANPHGLDADKHYSTASDMAKLMRACMKNKEFRKLCGVKETYVGKTYIANHNKLLNTCPGCIAGKTGYTMAAGRCLVSCCQRDGIELVCVTLSAPNDWSDHERLYDWAFSAFGKRNVTEGLAFEIPVISGNKSRVCLVPKETIELLLAKDVEVKLLAEMPQFVFAPVKNGETAGTLWVIMNSKKIGECSLVYGEAVELAQLM